MNTILNQSKSISLPAYQQMVEDIISEKNRHGYEEKMIKYIIHGYETDQYIQNNISLNKKFFNAIQTSELATMGLITEPWCLDACIVLSLFRAVEIINPAIHLAIYLRDTNDDIMNQFLTNGSKSIPIVFGLDPLFSVKLKWGPRSEKAKSILEPVKDSPYPIKQSVLTEFYRMDKTMAIQEEWIDLLKF